MKVKKINQREPIIPSDLATYGNDAKNLLKELQSQNERMFMMTFLILNTGKTEDELENNVFQAASIAQKHNCNLVKATPEPPFYQCFFNLHCSSSICLRNHILT